MKFGEEEESEVYQVSEREKGTGGRSFVEYVVGPVGGTFSRP